MNNILCEIKNDKERSNKHFIIESQRKLVKRH